MSTTTKNGKGTPGATTQNNNNGQDKTTPANTSTPAAAAVVTPQLSAIEKQMQFFDGLATLVKMKRSFERHKRAIEDLVFPDEELAKFETDERYGIRVEIHDANRKEYTINNPRLVKDMQEFLMAKLTTRIAEVEEKILNYGTV